MTPDEWRRSGKTFTHHKQTIFYKDEGDGEALLLMHGFPTASWDWHKIWDTLQERFRLLAPDMIGFGFSAKPRDYAYSISDQADLHETLLEALGVPVVHILAHDYGNTVAQEMLARYSMRSRFGDQGLVIRSLCFLNGGLFPETHRPRFIQRLLLTSMGSLIGRLINENSFRRSFISIFGPTTKPSEAELHDFWSLVAFNHGNYIAHKLIRYVVERQENRSRWVGALQTAPVPLRLVDGPEDPVSGAHMAERYRVLIPNADVVLLEGIGHYPQIEDPEGMLGAYMEFIDRFRGD